MAPRTGASRNEQNKRLRQLRDPGESVQLLMGPSEEPVDVNTEYTFAPQPPLEVLTQKAEELSPLRRLILHYQKTYSLKDMPVPAKPEGAPRRSNGTSSSSFSHAHRAGCCAQLAIWRARRFCGICARACRPCFRAGLGPLGGSGTGTVSDGLKTRDAIRQALSAMKGRRQQDETAVMPPPAGTCLRTMERKPGRLHSSSNNYDTTTSL